MTQAQDQLRSAINIRPGVGIISLFPHMNYKPWFALGELVDNALESYLRNRQEIAEIESAPKLRIIVEVSGHDTGMIRVWDNAAGIAASDYSRAFVAAEPPTAVAGLSQFGIGMKSASCWFARHWQVRTSALGETVERSIRFDVPKIVEQRVEELTVEERPTAPNSHFTELTMYDLYKPPQTRTLSKMADHLASIYRVFLQRSDVEIIFNDEPLAFTQPDVLVASPYDDLNGPRLKWWKPISFSLPTGESVSGFAGIRKTASTTKAGFSLFRHQRLIVGSSDESYRPTEVLGAPNKFRYQRVFGELDLDGFDVSHTKDGFIWGDRESVFLDLLREQLDAAPLPLLKQADNYRARTPTVAQKRAGAKALDGTARAVETSGPLLATQIKTGPANDRAEPAPAAGNGDETRKLRVDVGGRSWDIMIDLTCDPAYPDWLSIYSESPAADHPRQLGIRISLAHPFMMQFAGTTTADVEPLLRVAAAIALAEITARESGIQLAGTVRRNVNELLRGALSKP